MAPRRWTCGRWMCAGSGRIMEHAPSCTRAQWSITHTTTKCATRVRNTKPRGSCACHLYTTGSNRRARFTGQRTGGNARCGSPPKVCPLSINWISSTRGGKGLQPKNTKRFANALRLLTKAALPSSKSSVLGRWMRCSTSACPISTNQTGRSFTPKCATRPAGSKRM